MGGTYCFFTAQYLPTTGGVERYTFNLAKKLIERGNQVIIVTSMLPGLPPEEKDKMGLKIFRIPAIFLANGRLPISLNGKHWRELCRKLDSLLIKRIIVQTRLYTLSLMGMRYARSRNLPCITIEHGSNYVGMPNPVIRKCEQLYENLLTYIAKKRCNAFYSVSKASSEWLQNFGITAKGVLYNSVDHKMIEEIQKKESGDIRAVFHISKDSIIILFVGRLIPEKGILKLIEAVKEIAEEKEICLLIVGDGSLLKEISQKRSKHIHIIGKQPYEHVIHLLNQSDIFCLPSDSEGFPTSVIEAILCRCFVITTSTGGAKEIITSSDYGKIINDNKADTIKRAILDAINDPGACNRATRNAYSKFFESFTWDSVCDKLESIEWEGRQ